jgi:hypothetical protein
MAARAPQDCMTAGHRRGISSKQLAGQCAGRRSEARCRNYARIWAEWRPTRNPSAPRKPDQGDAEHGAQQPDQPQGLIRCVEHGRDRPPRWSREGRKDQTLDDEYEAQCHHEIRHCLLPDSARAPFPKFVNREERFPHFLLSLSPGVAASRGAPAGLPK